MSKNNVCVVGASGLVGKELIQILEERDFPVNKLKLLASSDSAGNTLEFRKKQIVIEELTEDAFEDINVAFFCVSDSLAKKFIPHALRVGAKVFDKSDGFRLHPEIPLVTYEVNGYDLPKREGAQLISCPNCTTIPLTQVLCELKALAPLERVVVSTYQAVSGSGQKGISELEGEVRDLFNMREVAPEVYDRQIAFNALPHVPSFEAFDENGYSSEENKIINETRKILGLPSLNITATCVRIPVFNGHGLSVNVSFSEGISVKEARQTLEKANGIVVIDGPNPTDYPTPLDASGKDVTLVGRIRVDASVTNGLSFWIVSDNLRTGAALNSVKIAEHLCAESSSS